MSLVNSDNGILNPYSISQKSDSNNPVEPTKEKDLGFVDDFAAVEDFFSYFCMYDDDYLIGFGDVPTEEESEEMPKLSELKFNLIPELKNYSPKQIEQSLKDACNAFLLLQTGRKLRQYFKGEISPSELLVDATDKIIYEIYNSINRVLNFKCKTKRYYIKLPGDVFFNTKYCANSSYILAFQLDESFNNREFVNLVGPSEFKWGTYVIDEFIEIDGDFSQIPTGTKLTTNDYLLILKKYPTIINLISHLFKTDCVLGANYVGKSDVEMQQLSEEHFQRWLGWYPKTMEEVFKLESENGVTSLSQETIDSITFVQPVEYVTLEEVKNGTFGTFEELLLRTSKFSKQPVQEKEIPKVLKLTP